MSALAKRKPDVETNRAPDPAFGTGKVEGPAGPVDSTSSTPFGMSMDQLAEAFIDATQAAKRQHQEAGRLPRDQD